MKLNCPKCSRPIVVSDVIELSNGVLSHVDCARPQNLTAEERALLFVFCSNHAVAQCLACGLSFRLLDLAADGLGSRTNLCPRCRRDLTENVRAHLFGCVQLPSEIRQRSRDVRDAAQRLIKQSQQAIERSDVLIREAEAHLQERQNALRVAMARRASS